MNISEITKAEIRRLLEQGTLTMTKIAEKTGVCVSTVSNVKKKMQEENKKKTERKYREPDKNQDPKPKGGLRTSYNQSKYFISRY